MRKIICVFLSLCLLCTLACGCGEKNGIADAIPITLPSAKPTPEADPLPTPGEEPEPTPVPTPEAAPVGDGYFADVWRGDVDYSELEFELYDLTWLEEYTAPIYDLAENGGSEDEFYDADYYLLEELYYIYTMYQLADLTWCRDPSDPEATAQMEEAYSVYLDANDSYFLAMMTMAQSPYAELMESAYHESYIEYFASYDPETSSQQNELILRESALVNEYHSLMGSSEVDNEALVEVFVELVELRNSMARMAGYENYIDYAYESVFYRDYRPEDSMAVWAGVKEHFAPLIEKYQEKVWDDGDKIIASDLDCSPEAVLSAISTTVPYIAPELEDVCDYLLGHGLYDISYGESKAQMGFSTTLYYVNQPFIFNAAMDEFYDYMDTIHEFGHFANYYATMSDLIFGMSDMDLSELQSQGMEVLFTRFYDSIFGDYAEEARAYTLMSMVYSVVDGAMYDEFLQRVYSQKELSPELVLEIYRSVYTQYGYSTYYGYEYEWLYVVHNFEYPFYYISYCVSALGALEIYDLMQSDWAAAVDMYMNICAMDTEYYYFSEALEEAGLDGVFDASGYGHIAANLEKVLGE